MRQLNDTMDNNYMKTADSFLLLSLRCGILLYRIEKEHVIGNIPVH